MRTPARKGKPRQKASAPARILTKAGPNLPRRRQRTASPEVKLLTTIGGLTVRGKPKAAEDAFWEEFRRRFPVMANAIEISRKRRGRQDMASASAYAVRHANKVKAELTAWQAWEKKLWAANAERDRLILQLPDALRRKIQDSWNIVGDYSALCTIFRVRIADQEKKGAKVI